MNAVAWDEQAIREARSVITAARGHQAEATTRGLELANARVAAALGHPDTGHAIDRFAACTVVFTSRLDRRLEQALIELERTAQAIAAGDRWTAALPSPTVLVPSARVSPRDDEPSTGSP